MYFFREVDKRQFIPVWFFKEKFKSTDIMRWPRIFFPEGGGEWDEGIRDSRWGIWAMFTLILVCKYLNFRYLNTPSPNITPTPTPTPLNLCMEIIKTILILMRVIKIKKLLQVPNLPGHIIYCLFIYNGLFYYIYVILLKAFLEFVLTWTSMCMQLWSLCSPTNIIFILQKKEIFLC